MRENAITIRISTSIYLSSFIDNDMQSCTPDSVANVPCFEWKLARVYFQHRLFRNSLYQAFRTLYAKSPSQVYNTRIYTSLLK